MDSIATFFRKIADTSKYQHDSSSGGSYFVRLRERASIEKNVLKRYIFHSTLTNMHVMALIEGY